MDFLNYVQTCGPSVHPITTAALIKIESGYNPLSIRNLTLKKSFYPLNKDEANVLLKTFINRNDRLAIGLMQITTPWLKTFNIKASDLLDGCNNIKYGTSILSANYSVCGKLKGQSMTVLECALSYYWSGNPRIGGTYINHVYLNSGSKLRVQVVPGISDGILGKSVIKSRNNIDNFSFQSSNNTSFTFK